MKDKRQVTPIEALGDGAIAAGGNVENVSVHVGDVHAVDALPLKVAVPDYSAALAGAGLDHFVGREWLITQIEELASPLSRPATGRYIVIRARAGMGKTALAALLSRRWDCAHHFTRTMGGRDTRTALQSLAAQLIERYRLQSEFAPGGMLPGWAGDPARFPAVLKAAAQRAAAQGEQVRLVVDGLDEADGDGPALGLPHPSEQPLPEGVVILATCREGFPDRRIPRGDTVHTVRIEADDPHNRDDIRRFLAREMRAADVAARLATAGVSQQNAVDLLAKRCDGVWIYLRYTLAQLRVNAEAPLDLSALPTGLAEYYRQQITGHRDDPLFFSRDLPVLSTLAVARQPVSREQLSRLSRVQVDQVRWLCDVRYRPFLVIDVASSPPRYSIYHASLAEFLHGSPDPDDPGQDPVEISDLSQATHAAHDRIADYYLASFGSLYGGPDRCLPALRSDPDLVSMDDRYPLRHLPAHLHHAGRHRDLDMLLTCTREPGAQQGSLWLDAHDRAGTLDDYLAAVVLARDAAEHETDRFIADGQPAVTIATETRCAMLAANLIRSDAIPATLLTALVRAGVWNVNRALWHAHRKVDPQERAKALTALAPAAAQEHPGAQPSGWTHIEVLDHALEAARAIRLDWYRPEALAGVAVQLSEPARTETLGEALATAVAIEDPAYRQQAFATVVGQLTDPRQLRSATDAVLAVADPTHRAELLAALTPRLPDTDRAQLLGHALDLAQAIARPVPAARVLAKLASQLPGTARQRVLGRALDEALAAPAWGGYRARAITQVAEATGDPAQLDRALDAALAVSEPDDRAAVLAAVAARLPEPKRTRIFGQAEGAVASIEQREGKQARALLEIAARMSGPARTTLLGRALDAVAAATSATHRGWVLAEIAAHLTDPGQVSRALDIALLAGDHSNRTAAVTKIAAHLTEPAALSRALGAIRGIASQWDRADAVTAIAASLGASDRAQLGSAADIARTITDHGPRSRTLAAVAVQMAEPGRTEVTGEALDAVSASGRTPWDQMRALCTLAATPAGPALQSRMTNAALAISDARCRSETLVAISGQLTGTARAQVLAEAATAARTLSSDLDRVKLLAAVATHLTGTDRARLLDEILGYAAGAGADLYRAHALEAVADQLTGPSQLERALAVASACTEPKDRASALAVVAARLTGPVRASLLDEALNAAIVVRKPKDRAWALYAVAKRLTDPGQLSRAVEEAFAIADADWVFAVSAAAGRLAGAERDHLLARALDRVTGDTNHPGPAERQLAVVVQHLTDPGHPLPGA